MIEAIVLAAGRSERFGSNKLLHDVAGHPMISHVLSACRVPALDAVRVVVGHDQARVREIIREFSSRGPKISVVENPAYERGLMSSVKRGLRSLGPRATGAMILLGDMPYVRSEDITNMIQAFRSDRLVVAVSNGGHSHPRLIPRSLFPRFMALRDDEKGTQIFREESVIEVRLGSPLAARDIDRPGDVV